MCKIVICALLAHSAFGLLRGHDAEQGRMAARPTYKYEQACGTKSPLRIAPGAASLLQHNNVPGAGIATFKPFETVLKDGFMSVDCVKDYMYYRGDKFGDNKHDYKLGPVSNVSIVHYEAFVAKEDQVDMTQKVCFEFCRTVPNMGFFGRVNGRGCYCTPYFTPMESDSSDCDAVCEGAKTLVCGGKSKSSVFAMHMCDSTKDDLYNRVRTAMKVSGGTLRMTGFLKSMVTYMNKQGNILQKKFGAVGDSGASGLMQDIKVFAGKLEHQVEDVEASAKKIGDVYKEAFALKDFSDPTTVTKAERIMEDLDKTLAEHQDEYDAFDKLYNLWRPRTNSQGASKQYYPVMYFVDKKFQDVPSTCSGDLVGEPIFDLDVDGCAGACDANVHDCVGFQYFKYAKHMCVLFSRFNTGFYYTGCGGKSVPPATCYAKLSKFEGTTLKPNPSGKCDQCFKDLTKADRCYF